MIRPRPGSRAADPVLRLEGAIGRARPRNRDCPPRSSRRAYRRRPACRAGSGRQRGLGRRTRRRACGAGRPCCGRRRSHALHRAPRHETRGQGRPDWRRSAGAAEDLDESGRAAPRASSMASTPAARLAGVTPPATRLFFKNLQRTRRSSGNRAAGAKRNGCRRALAGTATIRSLRSRPSPCLRFCSNLTTPRGGSASPIPGTSFLRTGPARRPDRRPRARARYETPVVRISHAERQWRQSANASSSISHLILLVAPAGDSTTRSGRRLPATPQGQPVIASGVDPLEGEDSMRFTVSLSDFPKTVPPATLIKALRTWPLRLAGRLSNSMCTWLPPSGLGVTS